MCGIYGILSFRETNSEHPDVLNRMGDVMAHRGPDDDGAYVGQEVLLGMRRLAIIDVAGGHQPISNESNTIWSVCNGEIYNFRELREKLRRLGHTFGLWLAGRIRRYK
jgi:asparagine synthase (glutamine-hydrolysing)